MTDENDELRKLREAIEATNQSIELSVTKIAQWMEKTDSRIGSLETQVEILIGETRADRQTIRRWIEQLQEEEGDD